MVDIITIQLLIINSLRNTDIYLPITQSWEPDFEYMENYIKKLETREKWKVYTLF